VKAQEASVHAEEKKVMLRRLLMRYGGISRPKNSDNCCSLFVKNMQPKVLHMLIIKLCDNEGGVEICFQYQQNKHKKNASN
jgi:hypothetical protein